jgi:predicted O-methyltransferase YrrM
MKNLYALKSYIKHLFNAKNTKGHGIHSPYLYRFTQNAIYEKNPFYIFSKVEALRENLRFDDRTVLLEDFEAGTEREVKVRDIAKTSLKNKRWAQLLYRVVNFTDAKNVLELGTSLGLTSSYLASPSSVERCITLEGSRQVTEIASENFEKLEIDNIEVVVGDIDQTLKTALSEVETLDVVFFDANHRKEPVLQYFSQCIKHIHPETVFIFDDIHGSHDMEKAWSQIRRHPQVTATIDLFEVGIVFFNKSYPKKTFRMIL